MSSRVPVTVVIPSYNYGHFLPFALDSVLSQTLPPDEIIVVDDGSTDNTRDIVAKYGKRVLYIHKQNAGLPAARNTGIQSARNGLIGFLDADDIWCPRFLEVACAKIGVSSRESGVSGEGREKVCFSLTSPSPQPALPRTQQSPGRGPAPESQAREQSEKRGTPGLNPESKIQNSASPSSVLDPRSKIQDPVAAEGRYSLVATTRQYIDAEGRPLPQKPAQWDLKGQLDHRDILLKTRFSPSAVLANKDFLIRAGLFDESLRSSEDRDMWIRMGALAPVYLIDDPLVLIRRHGNNMSRNAGRMKENILTVLGKSRSAELVPAGEWGFWLKAWSFAHFQSAWMYYEQGMRFQAVLNNLISCIQWPFFSRTRDLGEPSLFRLRSLRIFLFCDPKL